MATKPTSAGVTALNADVAKANEAVSALSKARGVELGKLTPIETSADGDRYSRVTPGKTLKTDKAKSVLTDVSDYDEDARRSEMLDRAGARISAIDDVYDKKVAEEVKYGEKDLRRSNTISAMTGMAGGPEAATRGGNADRRTKDRVETVNQQRALAIASIYDQIDQNIIKEKEAHLQTQRANAESMLAEAATSARNSLLAFAQNGVTFDSLVKNAGSDPELAETIRMSGVDLDTFKPVYELMQGSDKTNPDIQGFSTSMQNGQMVYRYFDNNTGEPVAGVIDLGLPAGGGGYTNTHFDRDSNMIILWDKNGNVTTRPVPMGDPSVSFEQWIAQKEQEAQQTFSPKTREEMRKEYEGEVGASQAPRAGSNYTSTNIPSTVKSELVADISVNNASLEQLYDAYPDVSSSYISSLYNSLKKNQSTTDTMSDEDFLKAIGAQ